MIIDERIFNELEIVDLETEEGRDALFEYIQESWDNLSEADKKEFCEDYDLDCNDYCGVSGEMPDDYLDMMIEETISLYQVPEDSLLEHALLVYGKAKLGAEGLFDVFDKLGLIMVGNEACFTAGWGYDIIDNDLLSGTGNGDAKQEFLKIVNEND